VAERVKVRRLTDAEGRRLLRIVRRGQANSVRYRRAMIVLASSSGNTVPAIAGLVQASEDTIQGVIHQVNEIGLACLEPHWTGGRPRRIDDEDVVVIVMTARTRPKKLGQPFTRWSIRTLAGSLADNPLRVVTVGRERLRQILIDKGITFQRTRTWKESVDPDKDAKLDRIEHVLATHPDRTFAFDQFGPLAIRPHHGATWAEQGRPERLRATYHRTQGIRYFHGCSSLAEDQRWGVMRRRKGGDHSLAALRSIRAARPDGLPIYVIVDDLSANTTTKIRRWAKRHRVELCLTPTGAWWANPIEPHFGPLRQFSLANSDYPDHVVLTRDVHAFLRWRNANARHPDVLAAQRRERARIRGERGRRWGRPASKAA
jgi:transposase